MKQFLATPFWLLATGSLWICSLITGYGFEVYAYEEVDTDED